MEEEQKRRECFFHPEGGAAILMAVRSVNPARGFQGRVAGAPHRSLSSVGPVTPQQVDQEGETGTGHNTAPERTTETGR